MAFLSLTNVKKEYHTGSVTVSALENVSFDLNEGESLEYAEDGAMVITGIDREIPDFLIFVGTVSDHTLRIGGEEISLRDLCGRSAKVRIRYEERWF